MKLTTIILAAGKGTRMCSELPKVLHCIAHKPLLQHVYDLSSQLADNTIHIVIGHGAMQVKEALQFCKANWIEQTQQLGTGHAVQQASQYLSDNDMVLILYGDVPLLKLKTLEQLLVNASEESLALLTVNLENPTGYGRIIRNDINQIIKIVEEKDATDKEKQIHEVNTGIMAIPGVKLRKWLTQLKNDNSQNEYYLTDIIEMAVSENIVVASSQPETVEEVLGVNNRKQLSQLERAYQQGQAAFLMAQGVTLRDPARFDLRGNIDCLGQDIEIDINVIIEGSNNIGSNVKIGPNTCIKNATIGDNVEILGFCVIENAVIGQGSRIGPFARLRPETVLSDHVHIGNFVEIKKSTIESGSKINHLSYIGDASVGRHVNIGAGTITCNYDGVNKSRTVIRDGAFIGSDSQLVAPVTIGMNATIGAGSTITKNAPDNQLTLSRAGQMTISGWQRPVKKEK